jgi:hypothetical protein
MDLLKNPVIIGIIFGILCYIYLKWDADKKNLENKNKPQQKVNLMIPLAVGLLGWFIAHNYYLNNLSSLTEENDFNISKISPTPLIGGAFNNNLNNNLNHNLNNNMNNMNNMNSLNHNTGIHNFNNTELANLNNPFVKQSFPPQTFMINKGGISIPNNVELPDVFLQTI